MDVEALRRELIDYVGTAAFCGMPAAFVDLAEIEQADEEELLCLARRFGLI